MYPSTSIFIFADQNGDVMAGAWVAILDHELEVIGLEWSNRKKGAWVPGDTEITSISVLNCQISVSSSYEKN